MNIAIDLDDVTVAIMDGLSHFYNNKFNTNFKVEDHVVFDLDKVWNTTPNDAMKIVYDFYDSPLMDQLLPIDGAIEGIVKLSKKHSVQFVTSRPLSTKEKTINWLNKYIPENSFPVYFSNQFSPAHQQKLKKSDICKKLGIELIIEDAPVNVADCTEHGIKVLLYTRPWNHSIQENHLITRVNSWQQITDLLS